jgi:hypothetical protein
LNRFEYKSAITGMDIQQMDDHHHILTIRLTIALMLVLTGPNCMEIEQKIQLANLTWRSTLPVSASIAINPAPSIGILHTVAAGHREILRLRLQMRAPQLVAGISCVQKSIDIIIRE